MTYLLDTNVVSEFTRRRPNPGVMDWFASVPDARLHLSVLTVGEIRQGIERLRRRNPARAAGLDDWLDGLLAAYRDRIAPIDAATADRWGRLGIPDPVPVVDGLLAATALVRGWTLVTRNVADLERTGVATLDPFT